MSEFFIFIYTVGVIILLFILISNTQENNELECFIISAMWRFFCVIFLIFFIYHFSKTMFSND